MPTDDDADDDLDIDLDRADGFPEDPADRVPAAAPRDQTRMAIRLLVLLLIVVGAVVGAVAITKHNRGATSSVKAGDCVQATADRAVKVLDCANAAAEYVVVGRVEDKTEKDASMDACAPFQDKGVTQVYWEGSASSTDTKGLVLCLAPNTPGK
jgi:hypothetical protein